MDRAVCWMGDGGFASLPSVGQCAQKPGRQATLKLAGVSSQCISDKSGVTSNTPDGLCGTASH